MKYLLLVALGVSLAYAANSQIKLNSVINSPLIEYAPSISADGKTMIYQSNKDGHYKLYMAHQNAKGEWANSAPIHAINNFGDSTHLVAGSSLSYDGNTIYFFASFEGSIGREDIWYVERKGEDWSDPINAGPMINSTAYEGFPSISADGLRLYFMRSVPAQKYPGKFCYRLYYAEKDANGQWKPAVALPKPIFGGCENCPRIMSDNETLLFAAIRGEPSKNSNYDLYQSKYLGDGKWSTPTALTFINTPTDDLYGTISSAGDFMYYNVEEGVNFDLYKTSVPEVFRPSIVVNIQGQVLEKGTKNPVEVTFIVLKNEEPMGGKGLKSNAFDGSYTAVLKTGSSYKLIAKANGFSADTLAIDLTQEKDYRLIAHDFNLTRIVRQMNITVRNNTNLERLSADVLVNNKPLVASGPEMMYPFEMVYGKTYLLSINKSGFPHFTDSLKLKGNEAETPLYYTAGLVSKKPELNIKVIDSETRKPILSKILIYDTKDRKVLFEGLLKDGVLNLEVGFDRLLKYKAIGVNHFYQQGDLDLTGVALHKQLSHTISLPSLKVGAKLTLNNLHFDFASFELTPASKEELENVFMVLGQNQNVIMEIAAHTDDIGTVAENNELSTKRAQAVYDYLIGRGVPPSMLVPVGYGETKPLFANTTEKNRYENRRVEFIVKQVR